MAMEGREVICQGPNLNVGFKTDMVVVWYQNGLLINSDQF